MSEPNIITLDIPFPISDYEQLRQLRRFHFVAPLAYARGYDVEKTSIKAIAMDDEAVGVLRSGGKLDYTPNAYYVDFYNIRYTRDCRLSDVMPAEWVANYGPNSMNQYLMMEPMEPKNNEMVAMTQDSFMRVVCLERVDPKLKALNYRYGRGKFTSSSK